MLEQIIKKLATKETTKLTAQKPDEDFLPYVCNYDKETILTKNGELLKIIRVTGLSNKNSQTDLFSLKE